MKAIVKVFGVMVVLMVGPPATVGAVTLPEASPAAGGKAVPVEAEVTLPKVKYLARSEESVNRMDLNRDGTISTGERQALRLKRQALRKNWDKAQATE